MSWLALAIGVHALATYLGARLHARGNTQAAQAWNATVGALLQQQEAKTEGQIAAKAGVSGQ
jgi:hypothetical protein